MYEQPQKVKKSEKKRLEVRIEEIYTKFFVILVTIT